MAETSLTPFEGLDVRQVGIEIPGVAGGLREPLKVDPQQWHKGERLFVVFELEVGRIRFDPIEKDNPAGDQRRVHITDVIGSAIVDRELVAEALAEQRRRVDAAKASESGEGSLPFDGGVEHAAHHDEGLHASGLVPGCPKCEEEAAAVEAERQAEDEPKPPTPIGGRRPRTKRAAKS